MPEFLKNAEKVCGFHAGIRTLSAPGLTDSSLWIELDQSADTGRRLIPRFRRETASILQEHPVYSDKFFRLRKTYNSIKEGNAIADQIASNMNRIADATYLQNALLERISVDSMSLVKDTHYIVDYKTPKSIVEFKLPTVVASDNKNLVSSKKEN